MMEYINKQILLNDLHNAGGCDAEDEYSKGWDAAIDEAIRLLEAQQVYGYHVCIEKLICKLHNQAAEITRLLAEKQAINEQLADAATARAEGQNEAWELARKIYLILLDEELEEIFGSDEPDNVIAAYSYEEAAAKVSQWEKAKEEIKVGDVLEEIEYSNIKCVVTKPHSSNMAYLVFSDGSVGLNKINNLRKTGRHIDIDSFLKQIGGECNE